MKPKHPVAKCYPSGDRTWACHAPDSKSNTLLSELSGRVLYTSAHASLDFLDSDHLVEINRA